MPTSFGGRRIYTSWGVTLFCPTCAEHRHIFLFQFLSLLYTCLCFYPYPVLSCPFSAILLFQLVSLRQICPCFCPHPGLFFSGHFPLPVQVSTAYLPVFPSCPLIYVLFVFQFLSLLYTCLYFHLLLSFTSSSSFSSCHYCIPICVSILSSHLRPLRLSVPVTTVYLSVCPSCPLIYVLFVFQFLSLLYTYLCFHLVLSFTSSSSFSSCHYLYTCLFFHLLLSISVSSSFSSCHHCIPFCVFIFSCPFPSSSFSSCHYCTVGAQSIARLCQNLINCRRNI